MFEYSSFQSFLPQSTQRYAKENPYKAWDDLNLSLICLPLRTFAYFAVQSFGSFDG